MKKLIVLGLIGMTLLALGGMAFAIDLVSPVRIMVRSPFCAVNVTVLYDGRPTYAVIGYIRYDSGIRESYGDRSNSWAALAEIQESSGPKVYSETGQTSFMLPRGGDYRIYAYRSRSTGSPSVLTPLGYCDISCLNSNQSVVINLTGWTRR